MPRGDTPNRPTERRGSFREPSLRLVTTLLVVGVAGVALASLATLRWLNERATRRLAAGSFLDNGRALTAALAESCGSVTTEDLQAMWRRLDWLFETLESAENSLETLSVEHNGVAVYQRQATLRQTLERAQSAAGDTEAETAKLDAAAIITEHVVQDVGGRSLPLLLFTGQILTANDQNLTIQLGFRRDALEQDEHLAAAAIRMMYRVAFATLIVALALLLGLIFWLMSREHRRELRRREEEHLAFAGMIANGVVHDFRNPMSSIRLDSQMLERETAKAELNPVRIRELGERMRASLDRIDSVFQEFFFLSQPPREDEQVLDLGDCVRECTAILQGRFESEGVDIKYDFPAKRVLVDVAAGSLRRALMNVLGNAVAFAPRGSSVEIALRVAYGKARLDIMDRGPGIPVRDREWVFEMFASTRPGGTGLGLFLARTALSTAGGTIRALQREGGGACLRMELPLAKLKEDAKND